MTSTTTTVITKLIKPSSGANVAALTTLGMLGAGAAIAMDDDDKNKIMEESVSDQADINTKTVEKEMSLWDYCKSYQIKNIPIIDFLIAYIFLYLLSKTWLHYDFKCVLVATLPLVLIFNLLENPKVKMSDGIFIILILSVTYLIYCHNKH